MRQGIEDTKNAGSTDKNRTEQMASRSKSKTAYN
jgi:hypothetical protein